MSEKIFNLDEACAFLGVKRRTMYKLLKEQTVPAVKIGGQWRFSREALLDLFHEKDQEQPIPHQELNQH